MKKDWLEDLGRRRQELLQDAGKIHIVNAGRMNHGKSSLFNALLDNDVFAVEDVRTTVADQEAPWGDDVVVIDTPGLEAEASDDAAAFAAYARANLTVFVHTVRTGAVERDEVENIRRMAEAAPSPEYFWNHFVLVFTNLDEYDAAEADDQQKVAEIEAESLRHIKEGCGREGFPVFKVSNTRYQKGKAEHKDKLVAMSGIDALRSFITEHLDTWRQEQEELAAERFAKSKAEAASEAQAERDAAAEQLAAGEKTWNDWSKTLRERLDRMKTENASTHQQYEQAQAEAKRWQPLAELERQAKEIFANDWPTLVTAVSTPYVDYDYSTDEYESRDRAREACDRKREAYCKECNEFFRPRTTPSLCDELGAEYGAQLSRRFGNMNSKLARAIRQAGFADILDAGISIGKDIRMRGDDSWFGFELDGKAIPDWRRGYMAGGFCEHFDRFISGFSGKVHRSSISRECDSYTTTEEGWFGREKKVRHYSYSMDYSEAQEEFEKTAEDGCKYLNSHANVQGIFQQIMDGLQTTFDTQVLQVLAKRIGGGSGMDVSVASAYDSKRRQAERLQRELATSVHDGLESLCLLDHVSDLPAVQAAKQRTELDVDAFCRDVLREAEAKQAEALKGARTVVQELDTALAAIAAAELHED